MQPLPWHCRLHYLQETRHRISSLSQVFTFLISFFFSLTIIGIDRDIAAATTTRSPPLPGLETGHRVSSLSYVFSFLIFFFSTNYYCYRPWHCRHHYHKRRVIASQVWAKFFLFLFLFFPPNYYCYRPWHFLGVHLLNLSRVSDPPLDQPNGQGHCLPRNLRRVIASQVSVKSFPFIYFFFSPTIIVIERDIAAATTTRSLPLPELETRHRVSSSS